MIACFSVEQIFHQLLTVNSCLLQCNLLLSWNNGVSYSAIRNITLESETKHYSNQHFSSSPLLDPPIHDNSSVFSSSNMNRDNIKWCGRWLHINRWSPTPSNKTDTHITSTIFKTRTSVTVQSWSNLWLMLRLYLHSMMFYVINKYFLHSPPWQVNICILYENHLPLKYFLPFTALE